ncbi:uncharacterized protein DDB_G0285291-like [Paramacrobiotus metropolitanus]|uniref:uncharacterized protein DDB_G0285291-like n=1 Tax=Paramacrobiotus metropolitanus TaxID=2943436 RepID=UPI002445C0FD|nr:uncharacterized protein DDB_G0285291-like [Paramacrobiotus metropolitanus]
MVEQYPRYFNPYRYFPINMPFWPGEIAWDGSYTEETRTRISNYMVEIDEYKTVKGTNNDKDIQYPFVEMADMWAGEYQQLDLGKIIAKTGIRGYAPDERGHQSTVRDDKVTIAQLNAKIRQLEEQLGHPRQGNQQQQQGQYQPYPQHPGQQQPEQPPRQNGQQHPRQNGQQHPRQNGEQQRRQYQPRR